MWRGQGHGRAHGVRVDQQRTDEALLACLGLGVDGTATGRPRTLSDADWNNVIQRSARLAITPLLYNRVKADAPATVIPPGAVAILREISVGWAVTSLRLHHDLTRVLSALRRDGIPVIVLKGAYLGAVVYGDIALRPMSDIDLMVRRGDLPKAQALLCDMGYSKRDQPHVDVDYEAHHHVHPLTRPDGVPVELHWTITRPTAPFKIDLDGLWERARPALIGGVEALVLSVEDLLLHLCLHAAFDHQFFLGFRACWDIRQTIQHHDSEIDWEQLLHRARQWGVSKYVYLTLHLAQDLLGAAVPTHAITSLRPDGFDPRLMAWAKAELLTDRSAAVPVPPTLAQMRGDMRIRAKLWLMMKSVLPSAKAMRRMYPACASSRLGYLYYPLRWVDLLWRYGWSACRLAARDRETMALAHREQERAAFLEWLKPVG